MRKGRVYPNADYASNEAGLDYAAEGRMLAVMDSHKHPHAPAQQVRPHIPDEWISDSGWALLWLDAILLIPAMFGLLFFLV